MLSPIVTLCIAAPSEFLISNLNEWALSPKCPESDMWSGVKGRRASSNRQATTNWISGQQMAGCNILARFYSELHS